MHIFKDLTMHIRMLLHSYPVAVWSSYHRYGVFSSIDSKHGVKSKQPAFLENAGCFDRTCLCFSKPLFNGFDDSVEHLDAGEMLVVCLYHGPRSIRSIGFLQHIVDRFFV